MPASRRGSRSSAMAPRSSSPGMRSANSMRPSAADRRGRHDEQPHPERRPGRSDGVRAGDARRGALGELLVVPERDGAVAGAQRERPAHLRLVDRLAVGAVVRRRTVLGAAHERHGRPQHRQRARRDVAAAAPADAVPRHAQRRALRRGGRRSAQAPVGLANGGWERSPWPCARSTMTFRPSSADPANESISIHSSHPPPVPTSTTNGSPSSTTGRSWSTNACPGTPSDSPRISSSTVRACMRLHHSADGRGRRLTNEGRRLVPRHALLALDDATPAAIPRVRLR